MMFFSIKLSESYKQHIVKIITSPNHLNITEITLTLYILVACPVAVDFNLNITQYIATMDTIALLVEPDRCYFTKVAFGISRLVTLAINIARATLMYQFILFFIVKQQHWSWM